jgi:DNA ligase D
LEIDGRVISCSNPERPYFPEVGLTKLDLVQYYADVSAAMLRQIMDRPTTLERWPTGVIPGVRLAQRDGTPGEAFYQKRVPQNAPDYVETCRISFPSGRTADEVCPTEPAVLVWLATLGTITMHPWPVRRWDPDTPDELRLDFDPQPGTDFDDAVTAALAAREFVEEEWGWITYPKTSGGRGVHVYVRIQPRWSFTDIRHAAIAIGRELERRMPGRVTTAWWKEERGETVFVDYNQNSRDRTIAAAWSVRARPKATVSTPLTWEELPQCQPMDFTIRTVPALLQQRGDPWRNIDDVAHDLTPALELYERDERERGLADMPYPPQYPKMPGEPRRVQPSRKAKAEG